MTASFAGGRGNEPRRQCSSSSSSSSCSNCLPSGVARSVGVQAGSGSSVVAEVVDSNDAAGENVDGGVVRRSSSPGVGNEPACLCPSRGSSPRALAQVPSGVVGGVGGVGPPGGGVGVIDPAVRLGKHVCDDASARRVPEVLAILCRNSIDRIIEADGDILSGVSTVGATEALDVPWGPDGPSVETRWCADRWRPSHCWGIGQTHFPACYISGHSRRLHLGIYKWPKYSQLGVAQRFGVLRGRCNVTCAASRGPSQRASIRSAVHPPIEQQPA